MKKNYLKMFFVIGMFCTFQSNAQLVATLDDLSLEKESYWNGSDGIGSFLSGPVTFKNQYNAEYFFWSGFAYSNITDNTTAGYMNQYSCFSGKGALSSDNYAVGYVMGADTITLSKSTDMYGMFVTNSTYAALSMKNGDDYSKKFGGESGNDEDWFKLTIKGWSDENKLTGTVDFYLADYRFTDNNMDYILSDWTWVDLTPLKNNSFVTFELSSTDNGEWGMNTPAYFCSDQITVKDFTQIEFKVENSTSELEGVTIELDNLSLTTDMDGDVTFENVSPTTQMVVKASKEGYSIYETTINGFFTTNHTIQLTETSVQNPLATLIKLYPNPANDWVMVKSSHSIQNINILNTSGQQVLNLEGTGFTEQTFSINRLEPGIYLMEIETINGKMLQKIFKQ